MIYVIIGMSLFFIAMGYMLTENNAKYLLAGYNTMSEEERQKVNLDAYIPFFKKFHVFLGISFFIVGLLLNYLNENAADIFLVVYPILAYIYFMWKSNNLSDGNRTKNKIGIGILIACLILILGLFFFGFQEDKILLSDENIQIEGSYGENIKFDKIEKIELVDELPAIKLKSNGFAIGDIKKGYFKTKDNKTIKLILNAKNAPYLYILKKNGEEIYYSTKDKSNEETFKRIKEGLPNSIE